MSGQLERELWGDPTENYLSMAKALKTELIAVIGAEKYDHLTYTILNAKMQKCKPIFVYLPMSTKACAKKALSFITNPPTPVMNLPPVLGKTLKKTFSLSISTLANGVSTGLAEELAEIWHIDITEPEISKTVNEYYNSSRKHGSPVDYSALPSKIYTRWCETWGRILSENLDDVAPEEYAKNDELGNLLDQLDDI